jgi:hypothetical protein
VQLSDPSLLRFLVDMRGADPDDKQLRDDLMTMLIAGARLYLQSVSTVTVLPTVRQHATLLTCC